MQRPPHDLGGGFRGWQLDAAATATAKALHSLESRLALGDRPTPWFPEYIGRELEFCSEVLGLSRTGGTTTLWAAQRYMVRALWKYKRVVVRACRSSGKTYAAGVIANQALYTAPTRVLLLAPTMGHLRDMVWAELATIWRGAKYKLHGELLATSLRLDEKHSILGIPCKNPDRIRGYHAGIIVPDDPDEEIDWEAQIEPEVKAAAAEGMRLVIIIDEPEAISPEVFRVLHGSMSKPNVYVLMIGNPMLGLDDDHEYVRACKPGSGWHRIKITAFPDADFNDPLDADVVFDQVPTNLISREARIEARRLLDPADPIFLSDWLGQFAPGSAVRAVIPRYILDGALVIHRRPPIGPRIGADIGAHHDPTVLSLFMDGEKIAEHEHRSDRDDAEALMTVAGLILAFSVRWGADLAELYPDRWDGQPIPGNRISIDDSGMVGVCDRLAQQGLYTDRVNFGARPAGMWLSLVGQQRCKNARAEMYWCARRGLQEGTFVIPQRFARSWEQLQWARFDREIGRDGPLILLEPKEDIIARHGRSPDHADADVLAMRETAQPSVPIHTGAPVLVRMHGQRRMRRQKR